MSRKECWIISCPCGFEAHGYGRGLDGEKQAWQEAEKEYLGHFLQQGGPTIDPATPWGKQEIVRRVIALVANLSI
ncbi:hypothetical protein HY946_01240 [Candidatus Gottesmanbacteria bacterium]|nr:hypothetical protein [Candidatus Gottesmanbacteria bacterium]